MIASSSANYFSFYTQTAFVRDAATASASHGLDREPRINSLFQVTVSGGTTGSGTVTINGTDASGAAAEEVLTFTGNGIQVTVGTWKAGAAATITTTGFTDEAVVPTLSIESVDVSGQPNLNRVLKAAGRPVLRSMHPRADWHNPLPGTHEFGFAKFDVDYEETWAPRVGDIVIDDFNGDIWDVMSVEEKRVGFGLRVHHYHLRCKRFDT